MRAVIVACCCVVYLGCTSEQAGIKMDDDNGMNEDLSYRINPTRDSGSESGIYIPRDLEDCFSELERMLSSSLIETIKSGNEEDLIDYHLGLGLWIRNNWGLWGDSRLRKYFSSQGIDHPDDMSGIIIDSFWRRLNSLPLNLEQQIEVYKEHWRQQEQQTEDFNLHNDLEEEE